MSLDVTLENLMLCDYSIKNLEISLDLVEKYKREKGLSFGVHPICLEEEIWPLGSESLDLVVSSLSLHWTNDVQVALVRILDSLVPDGALVGIMNKNFFIMIIKYRDDIWRGDSARIENSIYLGRK